MKEKTQFDIENAMMSVLGHLILLAIMMVSFSFVIERAQLVTPNRIEIIEIDLNAVKVTGKETKLYNTSEPEPEKEVKQDNKDKAAEAESDKKIEIKQPTLVDEENKKKEKTKNEKEKKKQDTPAPRKTHSIKVKREVLTLDRTMTLSVMDSLRTQIRGCWLIDTKHPGIADIRLTAHLTMLPSGVISKVWYEQEPLAATDPAFAYVLETVKSALEACHKLQNLPPNEFEEWRSISLTFYPAEGSLEAKKSSE